jgi:hypothetical protein
MVMAEKRKKRRSLFVPYSSGLAVPAPEDQVEDFIGRLELLIPDIEFIAALPTQSWQHALQQGGSYVAPISGKTEDTKEPLILCAIPLLTPRNTLVIEGAERIFLKVLQPDERPGKHLSDFECTRDLSGFSVSQLDLYGYLAAFFKRLFDLLRINEKKLEKRLHGDLESYKKVLNSNRWIKYVPPLDVTNPLAEIEHHRKLSFLRGARTSTGRDIHPSHYGRVCVVQTPESENIGLRVHLARYAEIRAGKVLSPLTLSKTSQDCLLDPMSERDHVIADYRQPLSGNIPIIVRGSGPIARDATVFNDSVTAFPSQVTARDRYLDQLFSIAALQIPFIHHNDPARAMMGAKNLKQATPLVKPEPPVVKTGHENAAAELSCRAVRAVNAGIVVAVAPDLIRVADTEYPLIRCCGSKMSHTGLFHLPRVKEGESISSGDLLADAAGILDGSMALGVNALVAYMPYYGFNIDDGLVVSSSLSRRLTSVHVESICFRMRKGDVFREWCVQEGIQVGVGEILARIESRSKLITITVPDKLAGGIVVKRSVTALEILIEFRIDRPLQIGDKLMGRHGNKGIVARIIPDAEMPYFFLKVKDGSTQRRRVEILMNPHGVISRMNLGQLYETHFGWIAREHPDEIVKTTASIAGKPFSCIDTQELARRLEDSGLNPEGKIEVYLAEQLKTRHPVTVGYQYIVKLNHLAEKKLSVRSFNGSVSCITGQPTADSYSQRGQRIGEMEIWALLAHGADGIVREFTGMKSGAPVLESAEGHEGGAYSDSISDFTTALSRSLAAFVYYLRGLKIDFEVLDRNGNPIAPEMFASTPVENMKDYRISKADESRIKDWGNCYLRLNRKDLQQVTGALNITIVKQLYPEHNHDEMGYIEVADVLLPVIPLSLRPRRDDRLNTGYEKLLKTRLMFNKAVNDGDDTNQEKYHHDLRKLSEKIDKLLISRIKGKKGIIRKALLGRRINQSCRAVIVPDPTLPVGSIKAPAHALTALGLKSGDLALLNRQPSLHIHNMQAVTVDAHDNNVIALHPLLCNGFNADFDGDTMAIYQTNSMIPESMLVSRNLFTASTGQVGLSLSQDIVAGLAYASRDPRGQEEIAGIVGSVYKPVSELDKKTVSAFVQGHFINKGNFEECLKFAGKLAELGLRWATEEGLSFGLLDLQSLAVEIRSAQQGLADPSDEEIETLLKDMLDKEPERCVSIMIRSGARGDVKQLRQMVARRGIVQRISGGTTTHPVTGNYLNGLLPTEYYLAAFGARNSLGDKKLKTPQCGYLTRKLAFAGSNLRITRDECGTHYGIELSAELAYGRTMLKDHENLKAGEIVTEKLLNMYKGQLLLVRSPLTCAEINGVCKSCYGWHLSRRQLPEAGLHVGLLAAEVIGERATQDAMRTYHSGAQTGTVVVFDKVRKLFSGKISGLEEILLAVKELDNMYEHKLNQKHYEVIFRAMCRKDGTGTPTVLGTNTMEDAWSVLTKAAFESADRHLMQGAVDIQHGDFEETFCRLFH